jgi:MFS family permease
MPVTGEGKTEAGIFWGWYVVAGSFLLLAVNYGTRYSFGIFVQPLTVDNGWSRSIVSLAASVNLFCFAVGGIYAGRLLDRIAPRWIATGGAVVGALGFLLSAFVLEPLTFYLAYGLFCGFGSACMGLVVGNSYVGKWFVRKQGLAIGISSMGVSFGTMAMTPVVGWIVRDYGWRTGFVFMAIVLLVSGVLIARIFLAKRNRKTTGYAPTGIRSCRRMQTAPAARSRRMRR